MKNIGNPGIFTLLGFGYSVAVFGVQQLLPPNPAFIGAAVYALLVGAIAEFIGGMWCYVRGETYIASITATFGAWLIGYFFLLTQGAKLKYFHPYSSAIFCLVLIPPVIMLTIPAIKFRVTALAWASIFLIGLLLFAGLASLPVANARLFQKIGGAFSIAAALVLWRLAWQSVKQMMDEMTQGG